MGQSRSQGSLLAEFISDYKVTQQLKNHNMAFLEHQETGKEYLFRELSFNDKKNFEKASSKLAVLKKQLMGCRHVVSLRDYRVLSEDQYCSTFYKIYTLFEHPQRTLADEIRERHLQNRKFTETQLWSILASCILGVSHLQKNGIQHSALRSSSILLSVDGTIKISDPKAVGQQTNFELIFTHHSQSHAYLPPQQIHCLEQHQTIDELDPFQGDIWTLAMIILEAGLLEHQDDCYRDEYTRIHWETIYFMTNKFRKTYSEELKNMVEFMLSKEVKMRPSWTELEKYVISSDPKNDTFPSLESIEVKVISKSPSLEVMNKLEQPPTFLPVQPSTIERTRPFRNIFPNPTYNNNTKVDENLVLMEGAMELEGKNKSASRAGSRSDFSSGHVQPSNSDITEDNISELKLVIENFKHGSKYEGYKFNGMREGQGKFYYQNGGMYDGHWSMNQMHGFGRLYYQSGKLAYEGNWSHCKFSGQGILYNESPELLDKQLDHHDLNSIGEHWTKYEGEFFEDMKSGQGIIHFTNGQKVEGNFRDDALEGRGKFFRSDGTTVEGEWSGNVLMG